MSAAASNSRSRHSKATASKPQSQRVKTPILLQMHAAECGAACLGSVLAHFGRWVSLTELRERCEVSRDGSSAAGVLRAARHYGLEGRGLSVNAGFLKRLPLPSILFWQYSHFVVLEGHDENHFYLNDPATGRRRVTTKEFGKAFSGVVLQLERGENFEPGRRTPRLAEAGAGLAGRNPARDRRRFRLRLDVGDAGIDGARRGERLCGPRIDQPAKLGGPRWPCCWVAAPC